MSKSREGKRGPEPVEPMKRFRRHIDKEGGVAEGMRTECHIWTAATDKYGHPVFGERPNEKGGIVKAHRYAYEQAKGEKLDKSVRLEHKCGRKDCVRVSHLKVKE